MNDLGKTSVHQPSKVSGAQKRGGVHRKIMSKYFNGGADYRLIGIPLTKSTICNACGVLRENSKDWENAAFGRIYAALAMADRQEPGDDLPNWLNLNGFPNLTVCPECHVDDFTHVEGCRIAAALDQATATIEKAFTANPYTPTPGDPTQPPRPPE